ncbi:MAG TPA: VWA domain-containing protein [Blastocatellia bacterium]|nr:VWA domain-containing protein [Blastocatellia bacterium]
MKSRIALLLVAVLFSCALSPAPLRAQSQQDKQDKEDNVVLRANEVVLDVVVRDKKGHAIKDLKPSDIEVYEDNVRQDIASFRLISREATAETKAGPKPAPTAPAPPPATPREPFSNISLVAMAFDHLSANGRNLAQKAAMSFVNESLQPDDQVSVSVIDQSLRVVQQYTNDPQLLRQAVDRATGMAVSGIETRAEERRSAEERAGRLADSQASTLGGITTGQGSNSTQAGAQAGAAAAEAALATMQANAARTFETLERQQSGQAQINSLLAIINSMRAVPGRKAIVLFSEGLSLPPDVKIRFPEVIHAATRANVSVYTVEAGGLRTESDNAEATREIKAMGEVRNRQLASGREDRGRPLTMSLERGEDLLKLNPKSGLSELAESTGGFMIADTNDLAAGLRRIDEDLRTHYEVTYVSKNTNLDGRFRQISVKLGRGGLEAQTRKGYLAVPPAGSSPVLEYEAPALAAMYKTTRADAFPLRSRAFNFPETQRTGLTAMLAEAPANVFTYTPSADKKTFTTDYTIVALVRNDAGQVVAKLSQHYTLNGPIEQAEAAKRGDILFYKEERLMPGHYEMDLAAYDAPSGKVSVRSDTFDVPPADDSALRLSSLMILKRADRLSPEEQKQPSPFHWGDALIYPNLGEPLSKAGLKKLPLFFNVYTPPGTKAAPRITVEVIKGGQHFANIPAQLSAPDATGLIQFASVVPLDSFQPGNYEMKVSVSNGATTATRSMAFTVAP